MSKKEIYKTTKDSFTMYAGFFRDVAQEVGLEKAVALHANQGKPYGAAMAGMLKQKLGSKKLNAAAFEPIAAKIGEGFGMMPEFEKHRSSLKVRWHSCPVYEACVSAGLDHKTIEMMCSRFSAAGYEEIKTVYPQLSACLQFRSAPGEPCTEEFVILK